MKRMLWVVMALLIVAFLTITVHATSTYVNGFTSSDLPSSYKALISEDNSLNTTDDFMILDIYDGVLNAFEIVGVQSTITFYNGATETESYDLSLFNDDFSDAFHIGWTEEATTFNLMVVLDSTTVPAGYITDMDASTSYETQTGTHTFSNYDIGQMIVLLQC